MSEHVEQLLGELGGEMEGDEGEPVLDDDYEPCSDDDEEEEDADAPMEHWPHNPSLTCWDFYFLPSCLWPASMFQLFVVLLHHLSMMEFDFKRDAQKEWH